MGLPSSCLPLSARAMISDPDRLQASSPSRCSLYRLPLTIQRRRLFINITRLYLFG